MAKKQIHRMEIEPAENGGHTVRHYFKSNPKVSKSGAFSEYHEPEQHVFGKNEGGKMLDHVAQHLGVSDNDGDEE